VTGETVQLHSVADVEKAGARLAAVLRRGDVILLEGDLGAGKTTLARGLLRALGLTTEAPSPTFAIVQGYERPEVTLPLAHIDLYRLDGPEDTVELGLDDWLTEGALVVEWPDRLAGRFDRIALSLRLEVARDGGRLLTARVPKSWENRWPLI
jgi:tRNA threonylcarbamoyladenosine biosynthesis protein TsaE